MLRTAHSKARAMKNAKKERGHSHASIASESVLLCFPFVRSSTDHLAQIFAKHKTNF